MNALVLPAVAWAVLAVIFGATWLLARRINNYGIVDIAWSYAFGALAVFYAASASGWAPRRIAVAVMALIWSARLGTHLAIRVMGHHPIEDGRYAELRQAWRRHFDWKMGAFFQAQALSVVVLGVAFFVTTRDSMPCFRPAEIVGIAIWLTAMIGEALADAQLAAFKRKPEHRGQVCAVGLWRYSRHPNYFFEWLIWVGYFVFALSAPWGSGAIIGPASILWLLLRVTGIPMTEEQSLRSRGEAYRRYQQTTSAFVPWFPRRPVR